MIGRLAPLESEEVLTVMHSEWLAIVSQFGAAGLMGMLWILERRHASLRDRQLTEAHRQLVAREHDVAALLAVVRDNTRAIVTLEQTQRCLLRAVDRIGQELRSPCHSRIDRTADAA